MASDMPNQDEVVRFHRLADEYGYLTNYARYPVCIDDCLWPTTEHYFQARKFEDPVLVSAIRRAPTPSHARTLGRCETAGLRQDWDTARLDIMRTAVEAKFLQYPRLAHRLFATAPRPLIEDTSGDRFWGIGDDGSGSNHNGKILMEIRDMLPAVLRHQQAACRSHSHLAGRTWVLFGDRWAMAPDDPVPQRDLVLSAQTVLTAMLRYDTVCDSSVGLASPADMRIPIFRLVILRTPEEPPSLPGLPRAQGLQRVSYVAGPHNVGAATT